MTAKVLPIQFDSMTTMFGVYSNQNVSVLRIQILRSNDQFIKELNEQGKTLADYEVDFNHMVMNLGCTQETPMAYIAHGVDYKYFIRNLNSYLNHQLLIASRVIWRSKLLACG